MLVSYRLYKINCRRFNQLSSKLQRNYEILNKIHCEPLKRPPYQ